MILRELVNALPASPLGVDGPLDVEVSSVVADSRKAVPGSLFVAVPGGREHGGSYAADALSRGASALLVPDDDALPAEVRSRATVVRVPDVVAAMSRAAATFHGHPSRALELVGVTGTNGKTTVSYILEAIWNAAGLRAGVIGTVSYRIAGEAHPAPLTTPLATDLQELLAKMVSGGVTHVVMEVSSHALAQGRVLDCDWAGAAFTNLTRDHLDYHETLEHYFEAKARLFVDLLPRSAHRDPFAVIHRDDPWGARLVERSAGRVVTFGRSPDCDVRPRTLSVTVDGIDGTVIAGEGNVRVASALLGDAHLENLLAAIAVADAQGVPIAAIEEGVRRCERVPGRMERVDEGHDFAVVVDYAHTPAALEMATSVLSRIARGRLVVVFGCGGDRDRGKRPEMGRAASAQADLVIVTSDNPRSEDPLAILDDIVPGVESTGHRRFSPDEIGTAPRGYSVVADRRDAIDLAIGCARPGDVVLVAGKGHETTQTIGAKKIPFDDRVEARRALEEVRT